MPSRLYRYRPCNESNEDALKQQIDSFEQDKIYLTTADRLNGISGFWQDEEVVMLPEIVVDLGAVHHYPN